MSHIYKIWLSTRCNTLEKDSPFRMELRLHNKVRMRNIWKYDWCLPSVDRATIDNRDATKTTLWLKSIGFEFQAAYTQWMWCKIQQVKPKRMHKLKSSLWCASHLCSRVWQIFSMLLHRSTWGVSMSKNKTKNLNDLLLATKCKKFNFPTSHNAAGPLKRNVDEFSRFCRLHLLHSRSSSKWNVHEMAEFAENERRKTHRPNHYEFGKKQRWKSVKRYFIWLCEMVLRGMGWATDFREGWSFQNYIIKWWRLQNCWHANRRVAHTTANKRHPLTVNVQCFAIRNKETVSSLVSTHGKSTTRPIVNAHHSSMGNIIRFMENSHSTSARATTHKVKFSRNFVYFIFNNHHLIKRKWKYVGMFGWWRSAPLSPAPPEWLWCLFFVVRKHKWQIKSEKYWLTNNNEISENVK